MRRLAIIYDDFRNQLIAKLFLPSTGRREGQGRGGIINVITWVITSANLLPWREGEFGNLDLLRVIAGEYPDTARHKLSQFHDGLLLLFDRESRRLKIYNVVV